MTGKWIVCAGFLGLALALPGFADVVPVAPTNAPLLTDAVDLTSDSSTIIDLLGALDPPNGVVLFKINIFNPIYFSAETVSAGPAGIPDTDLFLFNSAGQGVYANDDKTGGDTLSCLPAFDAIATPSDCPSGSSNLAPQTAGIYYLAISFSVNSPLDNGPNEMFSLNSSDVVGPNGSGTLADWDNGSFTAADSDLIDYHIVISDAPEPAAWPVTLALGLGLVFFRRKLRTR